MVGKHYLRSCFMHGHSGIHLFTFALDMRIIPEICAHQRKQAPKPGIVFTVKTFDGLILTKWEGFCGMGGEDLVDRVNVVDSCGNAGLEDYVIKQEFRERVSGGI